MEIIAATLRLEPLIDFKSVRELGWSGKPDPEILSLAAENGWLVVSHDVNTMSGHAVQRVDAASPMAGLLLAPQFRSTRAIADSLVLIWSATEMEEWTDRIVYLPI